MKHFIKLFCFLLFSFSVTSQTVYKTPSGKKYHLANCRMVNNVSKALSLNDAIEINLGPCKICNPPISNGVSSFSNQKAKGESNTVQCKGITKKGSRCKHRTSIANGYCFKHNPDQ